MAELLARETALEPWLPALAGELPPPAREEEPVLRKERVPAEELLEELPEPVLTVSSSPVPGHLAARTASATTHA